MNIYNTAEIKTNFIKRIALQNNLKKRILCDHSGRPIFFDTLEEANGFYKENGFNIWPHLKKYKLGIVEIYSHITKLGDKRNICYK